VQFCILQNKTKENAMKLTEVDGACPKKSLFSSEPDDAAYQTGGEIGVHPGDTSGSTAYTKERHALLVSWT